MTLPENGKRFYRKSIKTCCLVNIFEKNMTVKVTDGFESMSHIDFLNVSIDFHRIAPSVTDNKDHSRVQWMQSVVYK